MRRSSFAVLLCLCAFSTAACNGGGKGEKAPFKVESDTVTITPGAPQPVRFITAKAEQGTPLPPPPVTGRVTTVDVLTSPSFAPLEGRVVEVRVRLGDHVAQGDRLVNVQTADLATLNHDVAAAKLAVNTKQAMADRTKKLVDARVASENDLLVAQAELAEARLTASAAAAKLQSLRVSASGDTTYWVLANRAGTVVQLDASPGKEVGPSGGALSTVADLGEVFVFGDVAQRDANAISVGSTAKITLPGTTSDPIEGTVENISEVVDPERQTVPIRVRVKNSGNALRPNGYVDISFLPPSDKAVVQVPAEAIVSDGAVSVVFVETEPGVFRRRPVQVGRQTKERTEIAAGLQAGEMVVVSGALLLLNAIDVQQG